MTTQAQFGAEVVADARKYLGIPYLWGGTDPRRGLDCSGLTQLVMRDVHVNIARVTGAQQTQGVRVASIRDAMPGDLVFFGRPVSGHVGIYIGGNQIIHAPKTGDVVKVSTIWETPSYIRRFGPAASSGGYAAAIKAGAAASGFGGLVGLIPDNAVGSAGSAAVDAAGGVLTGLDAVGGFFGALGQRGTWVRVLQVVGGAGLVVAGVVIVGKGVVQDVAVAAIPGGSVVKAAAAGGI